MIYLDWASSSIPDREILSEALALACDDYGNPSSAHALGKAAAGRLEEARSRLSACLGLPGGAQAGCLSFTGSGTEADSIPLLALLRKRRSSGEPPHLVISEIEHSAVYEEARVLEGLGIPVSRVKPNGAGIVEPEAVLRAMKPETALVAIMAVNNETGAVQPLKEISAAIRDAAKTSGRRPPRLHSDAVQALGKVAFQPQALGLDSAAFSAHKLRGPRGIGSLWLSSPIEPLVVGGGQEGGMRPGTESLQAAWAFSRAAETAISNLDARRDAASGLEARLLAGLEELGARALPLGRKAGMPEYSPFILSAAFPGLAGEVLVRALSDGMGGAPIALSTGAACSSHSGKKGRRILEAMGLKPELAFSAIRISFGDLSTEADVDALVSALRAIYPKLRT